VGVAAPVDVAFGRDQRVLAHRMQALATEWARVGSRLGALGGAQRVVPAGGTSRFPQTPSTGPLRGRAAFAAAQLGEVDHAADSVLSFHQLEAAIDVVERQLVGQEGVDVDLPGEIAIDELRHLVAALDAAER
jgi:hypothetical protein